MSRLAASCSFLSIVALLPVLSGAVAAQCGVVANFQGYPLENGTSLDLINDSPTVFGSQDLQEARGKWTSCPGAGSQFPAINVGEGGGRDVHIQHQPGANPLTGGGCEWVVTQISGHTLLGATITIYDRQNNNTSCFPLAADIGHALGHILGLADATSGSCGGTLEAKTFRKPLTIDAEPSPKAPPPVPPATRAPAARRHRAQSWRG